LQLKEALKEAKKKPQKREEDEMTISMKEAFRRTNQELLGTHKAHLDARFSGSTVVTVVIKDK
jgi:hypothetical protein